MFLPGRTFIRLICYSLRGKQTKKEILPYPRCGSISFFCVLAPEGMNAIILGRNKGGRGQKALAYSEDVSSEADVGAISTEINHRKCNVRANN